MKKLYLISTLVVATDSAGCASLPFGSSTQTKNTQSVLLGVVEPLNEVEGITPVGILAHGEH